MTDEDDDLEQLRIECGKHSPPNRKITDAQVEAICRDVEERGAFIVTACRFHGVNYESFRDLRRNNEWVGRRVAKALAKVELSIIEEGDEAARAGKPTAWWSWRAERLAGGRYAPPKLRQEVSGPKGKPQEHAVTVTVDLETAKRIARGKVKT